jgi:hypothetical protein
MSQINKKTDVPSIHFLVDGINSEMKERL